MAECPHCEYNKKRAHNWRVEAYRLAGHPLPEHEQEPVGWIDSKGNMICTKINESCKPLYTTPQTKKWVGLTNNELVDLTIKNAGFPILLAQEIADKLKDKNT